METQKELYIYEHVYNCGERADNSRSNRKRLAKDSLSGLRFSLIGSPVQADSRRGNRDRIMEERTSKNGISPRHRLRSSFIGGLSTAFVRSWGGDRVQTRNPAGGIATVIGELLFEATLQRIRERVEVMSKLPNRKNQLVEGVHGNSNVRRVSEWEDSPS